ncbi:hypothetical protein PR048_010802 [Dryococelus australis]|uniref:Uncharacterized protein n=1 Tax=Dryococelus australis TaxID=614101 RepID=A0ABQ9I3S7_9NEOP|nr:hypothetical protein PR048_010802 [Dryococelus australis]
MRLVGKTSFIHDVMHAESSTSGSTGMGSREVVLRGNNNISETLFENTGETRMKHQDNVQLETLYLKDPGTWPDVINDTVRSKSINNRESYPRDWLVWNTTRETLHCLPCILFEENISAPFVNRSNLAKGEGFSPIKTPWKKLYNRLPGHENSAEHINCYCKWKSLQQTLLCKGIDSELQEQIACEADKLLDVMLFLASRGLPFQGDSTEIGDVHKGNFLGTLELLGKYDEIRLLKVLNAILEERQDAIYYATPDVSHQEQNVFLLRYVSRNKETSKFEICKRFVEFLDFNAKTGDDITTEKLSVLERNRIVLEDCRAQVYDNDSNMCGTVKGFKTIILEENNLALFFSMWRTFIKPCWHYCC